MALDGIVNVNSLFTLALFLGIVNADPSNPSYTLVSKNNASSSCLAPSFVAEDLIAYHVYSFSAFLFSSLIASALKQAIKTSGRVLGGQVTIRLTNLMVVHINGVVLRIGILACACGTVFGCVFLMLGLVNLVQIKLGVLACRDFYTLASCVPLLVLVPLALVLYICIILHASTS
uniref:Maternal effect embryo arrest 60 n=1 Tax=Chenopodium quinoa TaxID=63459 RepID=A0A803KRR5_CHEQI